MKIGKMVAGAVMMVPVIAMSGGCAADGRNTLTLGGYRSVSVEVRVSDSASYDPDKLARQLQASLEETIRNSLSWSSGTKPTAKVIVNIVNFEEPSETERVVIGLPRKISFVVEARDADTGAPLGEANGATRIGAAGNIFINGLATPTMNREYERIVPAAFRERGLVNWVTADIHDLLVNARRRDAP